MTRRASPCARCAGYQQCQLVCVATGVSWHDSRWRAQAAAGSPCLWSMRHSSDETKPTRCSCNQRLIHRLTCPMVWHGSKQLQAQESSQARVKSSDQQPKQSGKTSNIELFLSWLAKLLFFLAHGVAHLPETCGIVHSELDPGQTPISNPASHMSFSRQVSFSVWWVM